MVQQQKIDDADITSPCNDEVKILLIGSHGVGKTSLIYTLMNDEFEPNVPPKLDPVWIPASITSDHVTMKISDYHESEQQTREELKETINEANVICVVYIAGDFDSLSKVAAFWIPEIRRCQGSISATYKPVILVAHEFDLNKEELSLEREVSSLLSTFVEIEAFIEVSAKTKRNVFELFFAAQRSVTSPTKPLYNQEMSELTKKCQKALLEIFEFLDQDSDSLLNDDELASFQESCFGTPVQEFALRDLKTIILSQCPNGILNSCLTREGWLFLHTLSIARGRNDFTWQTLRKFNYDKQLNTTSENINLARNSDDLTRSSLSSGLNDDGSRFYSSSDNDDGDDSIDEVSEFGQIDSTDRFYKVAKPALFVTLLCMTLFSAFRLFSRHR